MDDFKRIVPIDDADIKTILDMLKGVDSDSTWGDVEKRITDMGYTVEHTWLNAPYHYEVWKHPSLDEINEGWKEGARVLNYVFFHAYLVKPEYAAGCHEPIYFSVGKMGSASSYFIHKGEPKSIPCADNCGGVMQYIRGVRQCLHCKVVMFKDGRLHHQK